MRRDERWMKEEFDFTVSYKQKILGSSCCEKRGKRSEKFTYWIILDLSLGFF